MIKQLSGTVSSSDIHGVVVDVSGWGVHVHVTSPESFLEGDAVTLHTHLALKQDGADLYGFSTKEDLQFFELCLSVSGIGPKTALAFLKRAPRENLETAIASRDINYLTKVAGLGKKAAEKLMVEIGEKLKGMEADVLGEDGEVFDTLVALGYSEREARKAVQAIPKSVEGKDARLKAALRHTS